MRLIATIRPIRYRHFQPVHSVVVGCSALVFLVAASTPLAAESIGSLGTKAVVDIQLAGNSICTDNELNAALCSTDGTTANAVVANGLGGLSTVSLGSNQSLGALANAIYYFVAQGPASVTVPILVQGNTVTHDNGQNNLAYAIFTLTEQVAAGGGVLVTDQYFASSYGCSLAVSQNPMVPCAPTGPFTLNVSVNSDTFYQVDLITTATAGQNASATLDPMITIDPAFSLAGEFSLIASPGVFAPTSAVPEPSSLTLLLFALLCALLFRRTPKLVAIIHRHGADGRIFHTRCAEKHKPRIC